MSAHADALAARMTSSRAVAARYGTLGADWQALRLRLREDWSEDDQRQFDAVSVRLRKLSADLGLNTTDLSEPYVTRVGDNKSFHAEPVAGITDRLGNLPPEYRVIGWVLGLEWHEAAQLWRDDPDGPLSKLQTDFPK
jgi:hypothetical protein